MNATPMKKPLLMIIVSLVLCLGQLNVNAQEQGIKIYLPDGLKKFEAVHNSNFRTPQVSCGPDTILYPYLKELVFAAPNDSFFIDAMVGNVRTASQAYHLNSNINILGVQFWGFAYSTSVQPQTLLARAYLYSVDAFNMPVSVIDSAEVTITEIDGFYNAMFNTPVAWGQNFAVGVKSVPNDTIAIVTNNAGNVWSTNYGEGLSWRRFGSGTWNSSLSFFGQDLEYMIFPIVSYDIDADFTADDDSICAGDNVTFTNQSSSILDNPMFNLYRFDEYWGFAAADSSYEWDFEGSGNWINSLNGMNTYNSEGTYTAKLAAEMIGYYTVCSDTSIIPVTVGSISSDTIPALICNGDSLLFGSQYYTFPGFYSETFINVTGCDSVVTLNLSVTPDYNDSTSANICNGETYNFGTQVLTLPGTYTENFISVSGCDSIVNLTLTVDMVDASVSVSNNTITATATGANYEWIDCSDNSVISGETGQSFTPSVSGDYAVIVTLNNCSDTSVCSNIQITSIFNPGQNPTVNAYPNPVSGILIIDTKNEVAERVEVMNILGEKLNMTDINNSIINIDLSGFNSGIYFVKVSFINSSKVIRVIKK